MNILFLPGGSSSVLFSFGMCMYTGKPNILRWLTSGFSREKASSGVLFYSTQWVVWLCTYIVILIASTRRRIGISWSCRISFDACIMVWFFHSATPFYRGLYGVLNSLLIPHSMQSSLNSSKVNSLPLSDRGVLIFLSLWFSTKDLDSLNLLNTSFFPFNKYIQVLCEKSYIKETYYTYPVNEMEDMGPHTPECTISSIPLDFLSLLGNFFFAFFPCAHPFQILSLFS